MSTQITALHPLTQSFISTAEATADVQPLLIDYDFDQDPTRYSIILVGSKYISSFIEKKFYKIFVIEPDKNVLKTILEHYDFTDKLKQESLYFFPPIDGVDQLITSQIELSSIFGGVIIISDPQYEEYKQQLVVQINNEVYRYRTIFDNHQFYMDNEITNFSSAIKQTQINNLNGLASHLNAVFLGDTPSREDYTDYFTMCDIKYFEILSKKNKINAVFCLSPELTLSSYINTKDTTLFYTTLTNTELVSQWRGNKIPIWPNTSFTLFMEEFKNFHINIGDIVLPLVLKCTEYFNFKSLTFDGVKFINAKDGKYKLTDIRKNKIVLDDIQFSLFNQLNDQISKMKIPVFIKPLKGSMKFTNSNEFRKTKIQIEKGAVDQFVRLLELKHDPIKYKFTPININPLNSLLESLTTTKTIRQVLDKFNMWINENKQVTIFIYENLLTMKFYTKMQTDEQNTNVDLGLIQSTMREIISRIKLYNNTLSLYGNKN